MNKPVASVPVFESDEYSMFTTFVSNRYCGLTDANFFIDTQSRQFETRLKKMIKILSIAGFDPLQPLDVCIINGQCYILDGLTRFIASKTLKNCTATS